MRVGFWLSNYGGSPLVGGLERGLASLGHSPVLYEPGVRCDLVLLFNQTAHNPHYVYPPFPPPEVPFAFIDTAEYGYMRRGPEIIGQYANVAAPGAMTHDTKNEQEQRRLVDWLQGKSFPYLLREFSKYIQWPAAYAPIDYPLYHHSECDVRPNREDYLARPLDLFVSWGASHPWRLNLTDALRGCHTKCEISVLEEMVNGQPTPRMPQAHYFSRMLAAKCGPSFDGYGSGSFRMTELLVRTVLLQGPLTIAMRAPLVDGETAVFYDIDHDGMEYRDSNIGARLRWLLDHPEEAFRIYEAGYEHCVTHLTERATAAYVLQTIEAHDWSQATPLEVGR